MTAWQNRTLKNQRHLVRLRVAANKLAFAAKGSWFRTIASLMGAPRNFLDGIVAVWHGSIRWGWFAVLLLGALTMTSSGEYGAGLALALLSLFSVTSKYWHWAETASGALWKKMRLPFLIAMTVVALLTYFEVDDMRENAPWSHLPRAWNTMLVASRIRVSTLPIPRPTAPGTVDGPNFNPIPKTATSQSTPSKQFAATVSLHFVFTKSPALQIANSSNDVVHDIKWGVVLWNTDSPERLTPLPIPIQTFDWLKPKSSSGAMSLFETPSVASLVKPGDHLMGTAFVDCPRCSGARSYAVSIIYAQGGWFSELKKVPAPFIPKYFDRPNLDAYFSLIQKRPMGARVPIVD